LKEVLMAEKTGVPEGHDYEYDEAHDFPAGPMAGSLAPHRVDAPQMTLDQGGDYGYDEAHDFGAS
jgi:hypothetical protein